MLFKLRDMSNFVWLSRVAAGVGAGVAPLNAVTAPSPSIKGRHRLRYNAP